ncbi:MAG: PfkB family carbohydrate kinase [Ilumatobacteraceae bacterium]
MTVDNLLWGPASLDRYIQQGVVLPGGGALNMAYHWSQRGLPFQFITRIGDDMPTVFTDFLQRHGIAHSPSVMAHGQSASIDITIRDDRQPYMDNFIEGVWTDFRLTAEEEALLRSARRIHMVLADPVADELERLGATGALSHLDASGDFLDFRHYSVERFESSMRWLRTAFIGWQGALDHPTIEGVRAVVTSTHKLAVITLGSRGVQVIDGRGESVNERFIPVTAVEVAGTTVGCGDAFIAAFLDCWWRSDQSHEAVAAAVEAGALLGAAATAWSRPLPDDAYN